jgi:WD40 repeat protein
LPSGGFVTGYADGNVRVYNDSGHLKNSKKFHKKAVYALTVLMNREDVASGSMDKTIKIWNSSKNLEVKISFKNHYKYDVDIKNLEVHALTTLNNGNIATAGKNIKILNPFNASLIMNLTGHDRDIQQLETLINGNLVSGADDNTLKIWDYKNGSLLRTLTGHTDNILALKILPNGDIVSGSKDKTIIIWNSTDGSIKQKLAGH